ncbi:MAG TPA: TonB-dependent receptor [Nevskiaceae bacterium]|nr:TonB-dependent receptor [Nevskiaceae bacterium]
MKITRAGWLSARIGALSLLAAASGAVCAQDNNDAAAAPIPVTPLRNDTAPVKTKEAATELDAVEVTGSRIKAVDMETSNPVFTIGRDAIRSTGATTIGELLQSIPAATGVVTNPQVNNGGGNGGASVNLRGLGGERTLVLLDGKRIIGTTFSDISYVDLNSLPINLIDHIEVLKEGASAIYGSDAIGGVVNIISRKNFTEGEGEITYGLTQHGDGAHKNINVTYGSGSSESHVVFGLEYEMQNSIAAKDRDLTSTPTAYYFGQLDPNAGTSGRAPTGRWFLPPQVFTGGDGVQCGQAPGTNPDGTPNPGVSPSVTRIAGHDGSTSTDYRCFNNNSGPGATDRYNFLPDNLLLTPAKRYEMFAMGEHQFGDDMQFYGAGFFTHVVSNSQLAAEPFDNGTVQAVIGPTTISGQNQYNPFRQDISTFALRPTLVGDRIETVDTSTYQGTVGLKGFLFDDAFQWDGSYTYGRIDQGESDYGFLNFSNLKNQVGPSVGGVCGTTANPIPQCTPINVFGTIAPTIAELGTTANTQTEQDQQQLLASISGDLLKLPAGALGSAFGIEYRKYNFNRVPDGLEQAFQLSENNSKPTQGSYDVKELFAELRIPVLADKPFVESLTLTPGVRYSKYSSFGSTTNAKYGIEYRPYGDLLIRATYADIFRAPTVNDLFKGNLQDAPGYSDPCNAYGSAGNPRTANGDLACQNVPTNGSFQQANTQASAVRTGNPNLRPETGFTTDFGLVYSPSFYRPLTIEMDYFKYAINDTIGLLDTQSAVNACFNTGEFCQYVGRSSDGQLALGTEPTINNGSLVTQGLDFGIKLSYPNTRFGSFLISADTTYLQIYDTATVVAGQVLNYESLAGQTDGGSTGTFPRIKSFMTVAWNMGSWSASLRDRLIGNVGEGSIYFNGSPNAIIDLADGVFGACGSTTADSTQVDVGGGNMQTIACRRNVGMANYLDLSGTYALDRFATTITFGITDITNTGGKFVASAAAGGLGTGYPTDPATYDMTGRAFFATIKTNFK